MGLLQCCHSTLFWGGFGYSFYFFCGYLFVVIKLHTHKKQMYNDVSRLKLAGKGEAEEVTGEEGKAAREGAEGGGRGGSDKQE
jgi:hypothetical protein